jgi:uncharacterized oxidoreductase
MEMTGNTMVITGGGSGIGKGFAQLLHARGNRIVVAGRRDRRSDDIEPTPTMDHVVLDQADPLSIAEFAHLIKTNFPATNVLINNAGIQLTEDLKKGQIEDAENQVMTNLLGPLRVTAALLPMLLSQPRATIINVSSALGFVPQWMTPTYCATKAAIHSYTQSLRWRLRDTHVEVIELVPPWVQTGLQGEKGFDPKAMPLDQFVNEAAQILENLPPSKEIVVQFARAMRFAERDGVYEKFYVDFNNSRG